VSRATSKTNEKAVKEKGKKKKRVKKGIASKTRNFSPSISSAMPSPAPAQELLEEQDQQHQQEPEAATARCASDEPQPIDIDDVAEQQEDDDVEKATTAATAANNAADADDAYPDKTTSSADDPDLPRSILRKIVKARLSQVAATELGPGKEFGVSKEALEALGEGAKVREKKSRVFLKKSFVFLLLFSHAQGPL